MVVSRVKLNLIVQEMEFQLDETSSFLNTETKEIVSVSDDEFGAAEDEEPIKNLPDWQQEGIKMAREVSDNYGDLWIPLPSKFDINEYSIMERFCLSLTNDKLRDIMYYSIKGKGAFRRFKNNIRKYRIEQDWYEYRHESLKAVAIEWCEENGIEYE